MTEDEHINRINTLADRITGLSYGAQGFDSLGHDLATAEDWRLQRDEALGELIEICTRLRGTRPVNGDEDSVQ